MASHTINGGPWPQGATVKVFNRDQTQLPTTAPAPAGQASTSPVASAAVGADGSVTFGALAFGTPYWAISTDAQGAQRWVSFRTLPSPSTDDETVAVLREAPINVQYPEYGAVGDGVANDTTALQSALSLGAPVFIPPGIYLADNLKIADGVDLTGSDRNRSVLRFRGTAGGKFIQHYGSHVTVSGLCIDGQRANQPEDAGKVAIEFAKPNGLTGGGSNIAGGLLLTTNAPAGASSLLVSTATLASGPVSVPVRAGEVISLVEGSTCEQVEVARTYAGGTTITLTDPLLNSFTTAAKVSVFSTAPKIKDCLIYGCGRDGISFFHAYGHLAHGNTVYDCSDTGIDQPSGCLMGRISDNHIEINGRWGIYVDGADTTVGPAGHATISGNTVRFLNGGVDGLGTMKDAIGIGQNVARATISGNVLDLRKGGRAGVMLQMSGSPTGVISVVGNTVVGSKIAGSTGIRLELGSSGPLHAYPSIVGNTIEGVVNGIDLGSVVRASAMGNTIHDVTSYGINANLNATDSQELVLAGNHIETCTAGIRLGGATPATHSSVREWGNLVGGASFAKVTADAGWIFAMTDGSGTFLGLYEQSSVPAGASNTARVFAQDNGSGKTQLVVRFPTGAVQVLATEP